MEDLGVTARRVSPLSFSVWLTDWDYNHKYYMVDHGSGVVGGTSV